TPWWPGARSPGPRAHTNGDGHGGLHQGKGPPASTKLPVGPSGPTCAIRTMISAPSSTVWMPVLPFRPGAAKPGATALIRIVGNALAYWTGMMLTAAFDAGYAIPGYALSRRFGSVMCVREPSPLLTFTTTGAAERCSSGRNAWVTRTTPNT